MHGHYNIYYLFLEDKAKNPMSPRRKAEVQKNLEKFYQMIKPKEIPQPLITREGQEAP